MLKQPCHTLGTTGACGSSFTQDQDITSQISATNKEISSLFRRAVARVAMALDIIEERRVLASLTKDQLDDIGLNRFEVEQERQRSYWDLPENRDQ